MIAKEYVAVIGNKLYYCEIRFSQEYNDEVMIMFKHPHMGIWYTKKHYFFKDLEDGKYLEPSKLLKAML